MGAVVPGLCSVTFRQLEAEDVIDAAAGAGLRAVEWGADVHVRPGDTSRAEAVAGRCAAAGLVCPSYGSYFFAGRTEDDELDAVLDTASALGASTVRVWAPGDARPPFWEDSRPVLDALARACDRAGARDITLAVEFHPGTLTETAATTCRLLDEVDRPHLRTYWQPRAGAGRDEAMRELEPILSGLQHLHVFAWTTESARLALSDQADLWASVLAAVVAHDDVARCAYLEFVAGDDPTNLQRDAATLLELLGRVT